LVGPPPPPPPRNGSAIRRSDASRRDAALHLRHAKHAAFPQRPDDCAGRPRVGPGGCRLARHLAPQVVGAPLRSVEPDRPAHRRPPGDRRTALAAAARRRSESGGTHSRRCGSQTLWLIDKSATDTQAHSRADDGDVSGVADRAPRKGGGPARPAQLGTGAPGFSVRACA